MATKKPAKGKGSAKAKPAPKPTGRPTLLTPELAETICDRIACGETLPNICRGEEMPAEATIRRWARADGPFREAYARAREEQMHSWADEIVTISDDGSRDYKEIEGKDGKKTLVVDHDHITRARLRVDTRKFLMAKIAPKTFGEKVDVDLRTGPLDGMTDEQLADHARRIAAGLGVSIAGLDGSVDGDEAPARPKPSRLI